jgi:hypothetical protein
MVRQPTESVLDCFIIFKVKKKQKNSYGATRIFMALAFLVRSACRNCGGTTCSQTCFKVKEIRKRPLSNRGFFISWIFMLDELPNNRISTEKTFRRR